MKNTSPIATIFLILNLILIHGAQGSGLRKESDDLSTQDETRSKLPTNPLARPNFEKAYCPTIRYTSWSDQPLIFRAMVLYRKLGYTASTWDYEPKSRIWNFMEFLAWDSSAVAESHDELEDMGYDEGRWNCCVNHYEDFDWSELEYRGYEDQVEAYEALGWSEETFGSADPTLWPESELQSWQDLTQYQRYMAESKLCYTEETWDARLPLYEWPIDCVVPNAW